MIGNDLLKQQQEREDKDAIVCEQFRKYAKLFKNFEEKASKHSEESNLARKR